MAVARITKRIVDATQPGEREVFVWDSELPGFGLKVTPTGKKSFVYQYRPLGMGRRANPRRYRIGDYGTLTPEQARKEADRLAADRTLGRDPAEARRKRKEALTVAELGEDFLADVAAHKKPSTAAEYRRLWVTHVLPDLGSYKVEAVTAPDVRRVHRRLRETPYQANRVLAVLGVAFSFAEGEQLRPRHSNPAHEVAAFPEEGRERFLTADEVARLGDTLRRAELEGLAPAPRRRENRVTPATRKHYTAPVVLPANPFAIAAFRFLLLTGCRKGEVLSLRWSDVDMARGFLRLRATKTGKSERPLSAPAVQLLAELPRVAGSPFVFPGRKEGEPLRDVSRLWDAVRHASGLEDVRLHDLRHTFASVAALGGKSLLVIGKLLGHKDSATTARYAHLSDDPVKAAADQAGGDIAALLAKGERIAALRRA